MNKMNDIAHAETRGMPRREAPNSELSDDPLALYESEEPFGGAVTLPIASSALSGAQPSVRLPQGPIALDEVVHRLGHVAWPEAVAIVEGLCKSLIGDTRIRPHVPELADILITAQGTVLVDGRGPTADLGRRLALTLHLLTTTGSVPVPLRLLVTKWASVTTEHSVADFNNELAYFARPDGTELIRHVYERAAAILPAVPPPPIRTDAAPQPLPQPAPLPTTWRGDRIRWIAVAVVVGSTALAAVLVGRALTTPSGQQTTWSIAGVFRAAADLVPPTLHDAINQVVPASSASSAPSRSASSPLKVQPASSDGPRVSARGAADLPRRSPGSPVRPAAAGRTPAPPVPTAAPVPAIPASMPSLAAVAATTNDFQVNAEAPQNVDGSSPIYSAEDRDVTPPSIRYPQLPPPLLAGVQEDLNTIELIISEAGTVERVRLLSTPKRMADMMLLSGAKTWVFEPALRLGQSVRYRLLLTWAGTP